MIATLRRSSRVAVGTAESSQMRTDSAGSSTDRDE
jgi:hypothetical protein